MWFDKWFLLQGLIYCDKIKEKGVFFMFVSPILKKYAKEKEMKISKDFVYGEIPEVEDDEE